MKPKAEDYELPNEEQLISQLEEMIRLKESIPGDGTETVHHEEPDEPVQPVQAEEQREKRAEPTRSFEQEMSLAQAEADRLIQNAKAQAEHIIEQAKQAAETEVSRIYQRASEDGYNQGYAEGHQKGQQEASAAMRKAAQDAVDAVQRFLSQANQTRDAEIDKLSAEVLDVAVAVAEKVIHVSLKSSEEIIKRMIITATEKLKRRQWVQIYVADCDVKGVAQSDPSLAAALSSLSDHIKIVPMKDAEPGTCIVEMPDEIIDASASTQLENIRSVIHENYS
ncbi:MAG TPA: F0F1 ATP synthase subunit delta [Candidatus Agathobaculum intestinipullorum]|nr:F0F1 ATP synthase subunit delta [Candidatus Agathobaculum intestinipullorum]